MIDVPATADRLSRIEALLRQLVDDQGSPWPEWMSTDTSARYADLSEKSIRRLISAGKLTAYRPVRGRVVVSRPELDDLIRSATSRPRTGRGFHIKD